MKIVTIIGARPQFIKAAVVSEAIAEHNKSESDQQSIIQEIIIHTGQHYDANMSAIFFEEMAIPTPQYFLDINSSSHGAMTGQMIERVEAILLMEKPDLVLVYGDTNSTLAGALAASKLDIPIAHVEAGLRSYNRRMPEEINRVLTDHVSSLLFCPSQTAINNLSKEGICSSNSDVPGSVFQVGDVMYDAISSFRNFASKPDFDLPEKIVLATLHRAQNTDDKNRLKALFAAFADISQDTPIVLPLHPRTREKIVEDKIEIASSIIVVDPVSYLEMLYLLDHCQLVMTDSGGLQKEAYFCRKLCITLRDETEWLELVKIGSNVLVGADKDKIMNAWKTFSRQSFDFEINLYGYGTASEGIVNHIYEFFNENSRLGK